MNDALKMQISAFIDGELPDNESELLLRRLSQDNALREQVAQYLHIGRLMRGEHEVPGMEGLRHRIAAALGEEPVEPAPAVTASPRRYLKPAAGIAVAASVALVALIGVRQVDVPENDQPSVAAAEAGRVSAGGGTGYTEPEPAALPERPGEMLTQFYLSHGATSADLGANGILTRLVTLELREGELVEVQPAPDLGVFGTRAEHERTGADSVETDEQTRSEQE